MPEPYSPSLPIAKVLEKWTIDGELVNNDIRILWEEIQRLTKEDKAIDVRERGSGA